MLPLPAVSVNVPAPTSMLVAPGALGVNVAVYTVVLEVAEKPLILPPDMLTSPSSKFAVSKLAVKVSDSVASPVDDPLVTVVPPLFTAVIVMVADQSYGQIEFVLNDACITLLFESDNGVFKNRSVIFVTLDTSQLEIS